MIENRILSEQMRFIGYDKIINKNNNKNFKFEIRFHLEPNVKVMKTRIINQY